MRLSALAKWIAPFARLRARRTPVILQMSAAECGLSCLAMLLSFHGRPARMSDLRARAPVGRDGLTADILLRVARDLGLRARGVRTSRLALQAAPLPAILYWEARHFVVLERLTQTSACIIDPGLGRCSFSAPEFDEKFTGVALLCESDDEPPADPGIHSRPPWIGHIAQLLRGTRGLWTQVIAASLILQLLGLLAPLTTKLVVDELIPTQADGLLPMLALGLLCWVGAYGVMSYWRTRLLLHLQVRIDAVWTPALFERMLRLTYDFFQQRATGDLASRLMSTIDIREALTQQSAALVLDATLGCAYLALLCSQDIPFAATTAALCALNLLMPLRFANRVHALKQRELMSQSYVASYLIEAIKGVATLKVAGAEDRATVHWSRLFGASLNDVVIRERLTAVVSTAEASLRLFAPALLLWVGAQRVLNGDMTVGTMLALCALASSVLLPVAAFAGNLQRIQIVRAHLDRLGDLLEAEPEQKTHKALRTQRISGAVTVEGLSFRYTPHSAFVLRDVSLKVEAGEKVAIVGRTGSGKSTLGLLLAGLHRPTSGEIRFDGIALEDFELPVLRRQLGAVLQETFLFAGSIRENILLTDPTRPLADVRRAARIACVADEIERMPMGYETRVSESSLTLSGGQRQRLALARALLHAPRILLLDEATSQLDALTEHSLEEQLNALSITRIVIAHRLNTVRNANRIYVLEQGEIVESGTHEELIALGGVYTQLVDAQIDASASRTSGALA